jgi:hypothetical protein
MKRWVMQVFKNKSFSKTKYLVSMCCFQGRFFSLVAW